MLASTVPVQWLLPTLGWRGLFVAVATMLLLAVGLIWRLVPPDVPASRQARLQAGGYRQVFRHPVFLRLAPMGFFLYGGMIALQALWIGPWLTQVGGRDAAAAARGLFVVNLAMLLAFLGWGVFIPRLVRTGWAGERLIAAAWPLQAGCMGLLLWLGPDAQPLLWALWCVCTSVVSLSQPAVGQAFPPALAGRALSAYNLLIFGGVFAWQWAIGMGLDALAAAGLPALARYRLMFGLFLALCTLACLWLNLMRWRAGGLPGQLQFPPADRPDNQSPAS